VPVSRARYALVAIFFCTLWASGPAALKIALRDAPPLMLMWTRFLAGGAVLLIYARLHGLAVPTRWRDWRMPVALGLLNIALYLGLTALLMEHLSAGTGAVLASTNPLMLALVAPWLLAERMPPAKVGGLALSYVGVAWAMWVRRGVHDEPWAMAAWLGCITFLVAATVLFKRWTPTHDLVVVNACQLVAGGTALLPAALLTEQLDAVRVTPALLLAQAYLILAISIGAMGLWLWLLRRGDATRASAWFFLNPVLGVFIGALVVGEPLRMQDFLAAGVVGVGIAIVQRA
jgi:drug/metabolite transporter (DMT)-like permease